MTADIDVVESGGSMSWRLSIAEIERAGPFSDFAGYDRTIVPISGCGFRLTFPDAPAAHLRSRFVPYRFDGGTTVVCELDDGPARAFNAMSRRATHRHELAISASSAPFDILPQADVRYVTALRERAIVRVFSEPQRVHELAAEDTLRIDGPGRVDVATVDARGVLAVVGIIAVDASVEAADQPL
jgi:environmental stress-induced protein Ves